VTEPVPGERIVGLYGRSLWNEGIADAVEFGILTAPDDCILPESAYSLSELQNIDGGDDTTSRE
jgi:hypothetical protein